MQDKTIDNALLALRRQIFREGLEGIEHVEALLTARGVALPRLMPSKRKDVAGKGMMAQIVMQALKEGVDTQAAITGYVAARRPELDAQAAYRRTSLCLARLRRSGAVVRGGLVWRLAP